MTAALAGPPASLADVAAHAGVSLATASRVLSGSPHRVAATTRQRVLSAAAALDFVPNLVARNLVVRRTGTFGVIVHDMTDEYFAQIARGIEDVAYAAGLATLICNSDRQPEKELSYVRKLRSMRVDAIIFTGSGLGDDAYQAAVEPQLDQFRAGGGVVVRLAPGPTQGADVVWPTEDGYRAAVAHLRALGHHRFGFVAGPSLLASSHQRLSAAAAALATAGSPLADEAIFPGDYRRHGGLRVAAAVLAIRPRERPTALLAANDQLAIGLLAGLRAAGLSLPRQMSVVGFGDVPTCAFVHPPLTTIRVPLYDVGAIGARIAIDRLDGATGGPACVGVELVVRGSTGPPA